MNFERMNAIQRRLHNAACVLGADGDECGFEQLQRDAIAEIERLKEHAVTLAETARVVERQRVAALIARHSGLTLETLEYLETMRQGPSPAEWAELDRAARA